MRKKKTIRKGITKCTTHHFVANVSETDKFNPQHEPLQILDIDVNGLYALTMREALPVAVVEWTTEDVIACLNIDEVPYDAPTGYIPEVDLRYSHNLHGTDSDFPSAPVEQGVPYEWLSDYLSSLIDKSEILKEESTKKLLLTPHDRTKCVLHYRSFKLYT